MELIDKDALVAEIEKYIYRCNEKKRSCPVNTQIEAICDNKINAYNEVLSSLDTLEVKEADLEEKATQLSKKYFPDKENIWARANIEAQKCKSACIEMVEWLKAPK